MYLLFDIGGTNMRVGVSSDGENILKSKIVSTPSDFEAGIQTLKQVADELSNGEKITGVAGGIAGPLDQDKTRLVSGPHMNGWINKPLKQGLAEALKCPTFLENDVALGGLGEVHKGAGIGKKIVAFISIGTGVGGARVVDGKLDKNAWGFEPGHQIIVPNGNPCNCGGKGHLEAYIGGSYIEKIYQKKAEEITDEGIWDEVAERLAVGLNNITVHWSPDIIILGGSVMKSLPLDKVKTHFKEELTIFPQGPELVLASLGHNAGLYGALELLK